MDEKICYCSTVEHSCASTVVDANPPDMNSDPLNQRRSSKTQLNRRKRILNILADIDSEAQLSELSQLSVQSRWLEWTDVMCGLDMAQASARPGRRRALFYTTGNYKHYPHI